MKLIGYFKAESQKLFKDAVKDDITEAFKDAFKDDTNTRWSIFMLVGNAQRDKFLGYSVI